MENYDKKVMLKLAELEDDVSALKFVNQKNKLSAGNGITIQNNQISADTTTLATKAELAQKQNTLLAGENITIENNVISASGGSCNCESDIANLQSQVNNFYSVINDRNAIYNTSYQGIDQNIVVRTSDYVDKQYNYTGTGTFNSAPFTFCVASGCTSAKLKITLKIKGEYSSGNAVVGLFLNSNSITTSQNFSYDAELDFKEICFDLSLSQQGNIFYFTVNSTDNTTFEISYAKLELYNCTNPTFMNKIKKYDVQFFNNSYYITNCTGKTAKYCIIHKDDLTSIQDIVWTDTNMQAQFMTFCGKITQTSSTYVVTEVNKAYLLQDNTLYFETSAGTNFANAYSFGYAGGMLPSTYLAQLSTNYQYNGKSNAYRYSISTTNVLNTYSFAVDGSYSHIVGSKRNASEYQNPTNYYYLTQNIDGTVSLRYSNLRIYNFGYGVALGSYIQDSTYKNYNIYIKVYDKIIKYNITYTGSSQNYFIVNSSEEIGYYDDYFEGANNDYFVVKDNKLFYYKN